MLFFITTNNDKFIVTEDEKFLVLEAALAEVKGILVIEPRTIRFKVLPRRTRFTVIPRITKFTVKG